MEFDYSLEPGKKLERVDYVRKEPLISVIIPFYNSKNYIKQTIYSVLNQTFPYFELLIIDDGSKDKESLRMLNEIEKIDYRIKVFHKENEGPSAARDFGVKNIVNTSKYLFFLDDDDLIEKTYLEVAYWTLETNKDASWAYTDSVGFGKSKYTWNKWFDSEGLKKENFLVLTAMIRKEAFYEVNGYELREKSVNEDWNFWLKLIAKGKYPVRMNFYGFWYRRKTVGELSRSSQNKKRNMEIIKSSVKKIKKRVKAIQYPLSTYNWDIIKDNIKEIVIPEMKNNNKINILMIIPWMTTGGADKFNIDFIKGLDKNKYTITVISTEPQVNNYRQKFEECGSIVYDLTTFIDRKYYISFLNYIIKKNNINFIMNTNSRLGYSMLPYIKGTYPEIPIIDYIHMEEWYNRNGGYSRDSSAFESIIDKTLVCNKNSERILVEYFNRNKDSIETVYIGVDENEYNPNKIDKNVILKKYNLENNNKKIISYICRIADQKRPHLLVKIIKELKNTRNDFIFLIVGDGPMLNDIKKEISYYKLNNIVKFLGNISNTKEIYAISDLTVNCSIKEGLALTSYESLSMGVPVVSADVGGQKELINETCGAIVPCLQKESEILNFNYKKEEINNYVIAINDVLNNLNKIKKNCRKRILNGFTINQMNEKMDRIITDIVNNPNKEKIKNGKGLSKNLRLQKELICYFFEQSNEEFKYQCEQYNLKYYDSFNYSFTDKLWKYRIYRIFIKLLKKLGILQKVKKILNY